MSHPLEQRLDRVRVRVKRLYAIRGAASFFSGVVGGIFLLGLLDYLVRFQDRGLRIMATLALVALAGWLIHRLFYLPLKKPHRPVDLALAVERQYPNLNDRLASAVEFLGQDENDSLAGSPALRRAVIAETVAETEELDFDAAFDARPARRAMRAAVVVCLFAGLIVLLDPSISSTAIARLANPFGDTAWPRKNHLAIETPVEKVARGGAFEAKVVDAEGVKLPHELRVFYRFSMADGAALEENSPLRATGVSAVVRRENVLRSFAYRIEGGDDRTMAWQNVDVVEPPAVETISVKIVPPSYTGWPVEKAGGNFRALAGARLEFSVKATKPLASATLALEGGEKFSAHLSPDGLQANLEDRKLVVDATRGYRIELVDREGIAGQGDSPWEIRAMPDAAPSVVVEQPTGNLYVTPTAAVPLKIAAKDDIAVRSMGFMYHKIAVDAAAPNGGKPDEEKIIELYSGPEKATANPQGGLKNLAGDAQTREYRWELEPLKLEPGAQIEFFATASDYRPQTTRGDARRIIVVTARELQDRLASRQNLLIAELLRVLQMQRTGREQVEGLRIRLQELKRFEQADLDRLRAVELNQRQVDTLLTDSGQGVPMHALAILADLENNRLDAADLVERMQAILAELDRIGRENLPEIARELTNLVKTTEVAISNGSFAAGETSDADKCAKSLDGVAKQQDAVATSLEKLLALLKQSEGYRQFHRDLSMLLRDQEETARRTGDVGKRTLTKSLADLPPQDVADLRMLAAREGEHARTLDRILQAMQQATADLRSDDPVAADTVSDALEEARRAGIAGAMRAVGENLRENQIGQSTVGQKDILRQIQEVMDILANRRIQELDRLVKKLREASADLDAAAKREADLRAAAGRNAQSPADDRAKNEWNKLAEEQDRLRKETEKLARRLERLTADRAAELSKQAAAEMANAAQAATACNGGGACQGAGAAEKALNDAIQKLEERKREAELELAVEQLSKMEDAVKHLHAQQLKAGEETDRLERIRAAEGNLTRSQLASLRDAARLQKSLEEDARKLAEQLTAAGAFQLTLSGAADDMARAASLLENRATGEETKKAQQNALRRLNLLLDALKPEPPPEKKDDDDQGGGGGDKKNGPKPAGDGIKQLAELKLLKLLQQEIQDRSVELQKAVGDAVASDDQRRECAQLADEQGRLAEIMLKMLQPVENSDENHENE
jgi:hypothetical protein